MYSELKSLGIAPILDSEVLELVINIRFGGINDILLPVLEKSSIASPLPTNSCSVECRLCNPLRRSPISLGPNGPLGSDATVIVPLIIGAFASGIVVCVFVLIFSTMS